MAPDVYARFREEIELLEGAGTAFELDDVRAGKVTPVFFGSAMNNFGVQFLLDRFLTLAPPPMPRRSGEKLVEPRGAGLLRLHLQDPGEHGSEAPRSRRVSCGSSPARSSAT